MEVRLKKVEGRLGEMVDVLERVAFELHEDQVNYFNISKDCGKQHKKSMEYIVGQITRIEEDTKSLREEGLGEWLQEVKEELVMIKESQDKLREDMRKFRKDADTNRRDQSADLRS